MWGTDLAFDNVWYLLLLALVPVLWVLSFRGLSGLGRTRRLAAILLRTIVLVALILALAETQLRRQHDRVTVIYLLDQSASIPAKQRRAMLDYVQEEVGRHRDQGREDRAGLIVFGREANIEIQPLEAELPLADQLGTLLDLRTDATNLSAAMKLAQATFPEDSSKRIVIITDGNENLGDARTIAGMLAGDGVGIDVVPIELSARPEVAVEKVVMPVDIRRNQPFDARVVLNNMTEPTAENPGHVKGTVKLTRRVGPDVETLDELDVTLSPGKTVIPFDHEITQPNFYEYRAVFVPADPTHDGMSQNNRATAFTHVRGKGQVLLIEDWDKQFKGEFDHLVNRLRAMNLEVTVQTSDRLFGSLAELQRFDTVVLANVPRSSADENVTQVTNFSDDQIDMLVRNTQQMGAGLVMLGGPNSFGAGGWANTELEKAMPVDFQIHNAKVVPVGALVMVMHASEMAQGNHWQKVIGREALKSLGPQDYCGVVHWDDQSWKEGWLWKGTDGNGMARVGRNRKQMVGRLDRMTPGDMPEFDPAMQMTAAAFANLASATTQAKPAVKHMIIISDGDPSPPRVSTMNALIKLGVTVTTVAVGTHGPAGSTPLQKIATQTGGKYYVVTNANALPRIFQREARRVARPLVYEKPKGIVPKTKFPHEMLQGVEGPLPPITGFVLTRVKDNPLVEVSLVSPEPAGEQNATVLASWTYGLGRSVAFTTDSGKRWATSWTGWENYDKLFTQMIRWSMRPMGDTGNFTVSTEASEGKVRIVVTALDKEDEFLNFLDMSTVVVGPDMKAMDVPIAQTAPGRYIAEFDADKSGSYMLAVMPGGGRAPIRTGVNIPYSAEFSDRETNQALLITLTELKPAGGEPGKIVPGSLASGRIDNMLEVDTFRRDLARAISSADVWPLLALAAGCVFLADVFTRRVAVNLWWIGPWLATVWARLRGRHKVEPAADPRMARLQRRKAEVAETIDQRKAATRFEPAPDAPADPETGLADTAAETIKREKSRPDGQPQTDAVKEEESYMDRLLKAKKRAKKD